MFLFYLLRILSTLEDEQSSSKNDICKIASLIDELENLPYDPSSSLLYGESSFCTPFEHQKTSIVTCTIEEEIRSSKNNDYETFEISDAKSYGSELQNSFIKFNKTKLQTTSKIEEDYNLYKYNCMNEVDNVPQICTDYPCKTIFRDQLPFNLLKPVETNTQLTDLNVSRDNITVSDEDFVSGIDYNDLYFARKSFNVLSPISYVSEISNDKKEDLNLLEKQNILQTLSILEGTSQSIPNNKFNLNINDRQEKISVTQIVHKYLKKLETYLNFDKVKDETFMGKIPKAYYLSKLKNPLQEIDKKNKRSMFLIEEGIGKFYMTVTNFDIIKSRNYKVPNDIFIEFYLGKNLCNCSHAIFLRCLKRNNTLISNRNIYLYLTIEMKNFVSSVPYGIISDICYLQKIMREIEKIQKKINEFTELSTVYSLLKFQRCDTLDNITVYVFTRVINIMLENNVRDKNDRIYICYNYIFLILRKFSSKLRKETTDGKMSNPYVSMFIISSDVLWRSKSSSLHEIVKFKSTDTIDIVLTSKNLLAHIFFSLEIIFVSKILDDYEVDDLNVRYKCRSILERQIIKYFDKSYGIYKYLLMKTCLALHNYITKKDFSMLNKLEHKKSIKYQDLL